jgi:hypothetical protein
MSRLVYRPNDPRSNENGLLPVELATSHSEAAGFYVISDEMDATRHMADNKLYTSKHKFREATRAAGCLEVGNETAALMKPRTPVPLDRRARREAIRRTIYDLRNGQRR